MRPISWKDLRGFCESKGCIHSRTKGDHYTMTRPGMLRPVVFPMKNDLREGIVFGILRTMGTTKSDLEDYLNPPKKSTSSPEDPALR